ncbi:MAG: hypothetical protein ACAF41_34465 (plasmid) [Leptolyngbya sp. BL-A-14]
METSPTSYLQTLPKDEAIAFVASLQTVKDHLSQALLWLEAQVQQKTVQLQGIETLLSEADTLGLVVAAPYSTPTPNTPEGASELLPTETGSPLSVIATESVAAVIAAPTPKKPSKQPSRQQRNVASAKASRDSKPVAATKTSTAKAKPPKPATPPARNANQRGQASPLQPFLKSQWRDKALTAAVSDILAQAEVPLSTDAVMAALYDGLPTAAYDRAKHSLANTLSVGRSKGLWQSAGRGLYAAQAATTA